MSGTSRKVKNPLLSAAGMGSPFEHYPENALLVPVTPATPAVLRDEAELDNFVGQEFGQSKDSSTSQTVSKNESERENSSTNISVNSEESKLSTNQPTKQGYFTSILSSLPNLSLSSIKADSSGSQEVGEVITGKQDINPYSVSQNRNASLPETSSFLAINPHDPYGVNQSGSSEANLKAKTFTAPPQQTLPPTVPISTGGPVSYRLGNQRRLKYAPTPDLTSNTTKQYSNPPVQPLFSSSNVLTPSSILNPNATTIEQHKSNSNPALSQTSVISPSEQLATPEQHSQSTSLHGSFRSSPSTIGAFSNSSVVSLNPIDETSLTTGPSGYSISSSRSIPPRNLDPATPQNTPANVSSFGFYANQPDLLMRFGSASYNEKDQGVTDNQYTHSQDIFKQGSSNSTLNVSKTQSLVSPIVNTFRPISAAKVTEKLEHFLAEQKEESPSGTSSDFSSEVANVTPQNRNEIKTLDLKSILQPSGESKEESNQIKSNDEPSNANLSKSDSLSDVPLNQSSFNNSISLKDPQDLRKTQGITFDSQTSQLNLTPLQQSNQTQALPILPLDNIFPETTTETAINSNPESIQEESRLNSELVGFSLNTFIEPVDNKTNYSLSHRQQSDINTNQVSNIELHKKEEYPSFNQHSTDPILAIPPSIWNTNKNIQTHSNDSTHNNQVPPPPQFYNPAQLMGEAYKYQYPESIFMPTNNTVYNSQTHAFIDQSSKLEESRNIVPDNDFIYAQRSIPMATAVPEPTGSATLSPIQFSTSPFSGHMTPDSIPQSLQNLALGVPTGRMQYKQINHHWFYRKEIENKVLWHPFSMKDSLRLEDVHNSVEITTETTVATDGGRYDVDILRRRRSPVYWTGPSTEVRRCSWFYKGPSDSKYIPYDESIAAKLEEEFKHACITNSWNRRIDLNNGEYIIFHSETVHVHYLQTNSSDASASWSNPTDSEDGTYLQGGSTRPRVVKRGVVEFSIDQGEPEKIDHLLFVVHGIGSVCDLKFRSVEEVVDEFRSISLQLVQSHYHTASEQGIVNRIEVLPISWHTTLHSDTGIDKKLKAITLESIPKLRHFTNDTLLDILFYTSPIYCETIMQTVGNEMNRLYSLFKERNPDFKGEVYFSGHSLGSLIMFDLLCHQNPPAIEENEEEKDSEVNDEKKNENIGPTQPLHGSILKRRLSKKISYVMGAAGTGQPYIHYPQINFHPRAFFALGSPIGMFVTIRGIDTLGENFALPTCPAFFNIFHPFDPVAYRVESLINPEAHKYRPMLIPHHKGRKRMHLELKETMARVGADLKQKLIDSFRNTWNSFYDSFYHFHKPDNNVLEREIDKVVEEQLQQTPNVSEQPNNDDGGADIKMGNLNGGRRIDYVLQEAPLEYINEYIFALTSHVCYWESEDTILMILKEIYGSMGIQTDAKLPQQTLSIERPSRSSSPSISNSFKSETIMPVIGMDPTMPISKKSIGPPPITGFVRKS